MSALIAEQAREIAVLKVLGGRRRQIGGITARTAGLLGLAAAVVGTILGVAVAYLLARYLPSGSSMSRSASASRPRSSWPAWWPPRCSQSPRRCPPCGARCASRPPRPSPE
jgi:predicted lysophospholipase L1 biosynthesis ABC-type transport system permease subunit